MIAQPQEPYSLNPLFLSGEETATLVPLIYSYLLTLDEHDMLQPDIAASVPSRKNRGISRDGLTITYHLRHDARWQDGQPITARDVAFTFTAIMNPRNNVVSRAGYDRIKSVEGVNATTVRVRLRAPYAPILSEFLAPNQNYGILPAHLLQRFHDVNNVPYNSAPVGSGPYRVVRWIHGDHLTLARNTNYYKGTPHIPKIQVRFVPNTNTILSQLRSGESTATLMADAAHLSEYRTLSDERVLRAPLAGVGELFFNVRDPDLADARIRRALIQAVDLRRVVHNATRGAQTFDQAGRGLFSWGYDPAIQPSKFNPAAAARVLKPRRLSLQFSFVSGNAVASAIGVQLVQQLRAAGVDLTLRSYSPAQFRAQASSGGPLYSGKFQIAFLEIYTPADPDVDWNFGCRQIPPGGFNLSWYCDPQTDRAAAAGLATYDTALRRHYSSIVQRRIMEELPALPTLATKCRLRGPTRFARVPSCCRIARVEYFAVVH